jgi:Phosphodiester glycosidase
VRRSALAAAFLSSLFVAAPAPAAELPLGPRSLDERRAVSRLAPGVRWIRIVREGGPWRVNVLSVATRVLAAPAEAIGERERPSAIARRLRAVAAVNGGYFAADGNPVGVLAAGGRLLSEPVGGRSALLLDGSGARVTALRFDASARIGGQPALLDGINRTPGSIPACGGRGGDRPTERPDAPATCTDPSELVLFTPEWEGRTPRAAAGERRLDVVVRGGVVSASRPRGATVVPDDGQVLAATGEAAGLLRSASGPGATVELNLAMRSPFGRLCVPWPAKSTNRCASPAIEAPAGIVGGGPRLLVHGRVRVRSSAEGFAPLSAPWFHGSFVAARHPRTLAGVRADGRLLLVTVDGRRTGWSAGVTLPEAARLMRSLGAREALNLDGGGSSSMVVRGRVVNRPSDPTGERAVSDALVVLP